MIDIHSHILPGLDDGAKTEEDAIAMANAAVENGIKTMIATPHHKNGRYENTPETIKLHVSIFNKLLKDLQIPLTLLPGQEIRLNGDIVKELKNKELLTLNHSKYLFVEFPTGHVPQYSEQILFELLIAGYVPIIVHPERNGELIRNPLRLYEFVKQGALAQITAGSVKGTFGRNIQKFSHQLIRANLTHFIATDAHNTTSRSFLLKEALDEVKWVFGTDYYTMFLENSELLVANKDVHVFEPIMPRKKLLGLF
ncbi:tyrosine protein phosphatase [Bacillus sp. FJAT-27225]|uniref:tyrosine-protein phosphatase n=1 Tax=Bacillus sp. FJAT-27225 TaxID=1743144 RepID=UPI00080C2A0D|nr:CpsB/CapC family capsule biosynthesis tyrosine phosphatase [Bacillus sp. FJAT-27225]OCA85948.1 tyrosine protein phosphatase [Bacillus sp. FJAT-27225]